MERRVEAKVESDEKQCGEGQGERPLSDGPDGAAAKRPRITTNGAVTSPSSAAAAGVMPPARMSPTADVSSSSSGSSNSRSNLNPKSATAAEPQPLVQSSLLSARRPEQPVQSIENSGGICFMAAPPTAVLQSVMHFLDCRSLLHFARGGRWLYAAANSAFAWQHAPPPALLFSDARLSLLHQLSQSLWRHLSSVAIDWKSSLLYESRRPSHSELTAVLRMPRISTLSIHRIQLSSEQWRQLGQSSSLDSLTSLELSWCNAPVGFLQFLLRLPRLNSLVLGHCSLSQGESLAFLSQLVSLTRLELDLRPRNQGADTMRGVWLGNIAPCRGLTSLTLHWVHLDQPAFLTMLHSPTLRASLCELTLEACDLQPRWSSLSDQQRSAMQAAFSGFSELSSLSFAPFSVFHADELLLHVARSLPLGKLELAPYCSSCVPDPTLVKQLLQSAPGLQFTLDLMHFRCANSLSFRQIRLPTDQISRFKLITE